MTIWLWIGFLVLVICFLAIDLGVLNRTDHVIRAREALKWTGVWIGAALLFNVLIYFIYQGHWLGIGLESRDRIDGREAAIVFFTGYIIEKSLSLDNLFVIALIFKFFKVPMQYQHRVLFWGVVGALVLRGIMIIAGVTLIQKFSWMIYIFGAFLIYTALKMLIHPDAELDLENHRIVKLVKRFFRISPELDGHSFFTRIDGQRAITPLFLVLLIVEGSDVVFAVDSIPAIFGVTQDPFIIFTSNIFAILGLRSLYFVLAQLLHRFYYLQLSLVFVLAYVGVKMIVSRLVHIPPWISLCVIGGVLTIGILASVIRARRENQSEGKRED